MPVGEKFERYYREAQRGQKLQLHDEDETIQSKFPVHGGEIILTQTRLYITTDEEREVVPNVRLERSKPRVFIKEEWLEIAPRMGASLMRRQTGREFLQMVEQLRQKALDRLESRARPAREGIRRRYDLILDRARAHGQAGDGRKMKDTLRGLHAAVPERLEAAERLGTAYLDEGNGRAAIIWLSRAGVFDERFDRALSRVERPRLPSREQPPPEWWLDRHLTPLLERDAEAGPTVEQRSRIRAARQRIAEHRARRGRAHPVAQAIFVLAVVVWCVLVFLSPWRILGSTAAATLVVGLASLWRNRRRRRRRRH